jgi:SAM-dependent methyltransferase
MIERGGCGPAGAGDMWVNGDFQFDRIAQDIFFPIYAVIADDILAKTQKTAGRMIDIGCGGGHLGLALMGKTQCDGYFVDINETALEIAKARATECGLADRAVFLKEDVHELTFPDSFADLVISRGSYIFWRDMEKALLEIYRVLAPGGRTYIGGGLGNRELAESIRQKMQGIQPGWPEGIQGRAAEMPPERIKEIFDREGIAHEIIDDESRGFWIVLSK